MSLAVAVYAIGVVIGLLVMRDRLVPRLVTALLWPLGPVAGVLVIGGLLIVTVILWPLTMIAGAAVVGGAWYLLG